MVLRLIGAISLYFSLFFAASVQAEVMFEGYYIIRLQGAQVGYTVQRYEFDAKAKQFSSTYFLKTNAMGGNISESLKAKCNDKFQPISYQYTNQTGDQLKTIDASFTGDSMKAVVSDGKTSQTITKKLQKGTFLSTFLGYLMLQNGYEVGKKFTYSAIAEEDAEGYTGEALIKSEEKYGGLPAYRILNVFKGSEFVSFVTIKGEVLGTTSPVQNIATELVAGPGAATQGQIVPNKTLALLFGSVPLGKVNTVTQGGAANPPAAASKPNATNLNSTPSPTPTQAPSGAPGKVEIGTPKSGGSKGP